jgi:hypothetical protein
MPTFFNKFPVVRYDMENKRYFYQNNQIVTNVLFRIGIIKEVLTNIASYYEYTVRDDEKPEILADKFYNDPEGHWVILYANDIFDPQYDWPLDSKSFNKYLADKYRSQAEADLGAGISDFRVIDWTRDTTNPNSVHHYEKIITRENSVSKIIDEKRIEINKKKEWLISYLEVPFDVYEELPEQTVEFFNLSNTGVTITQTITKTAITYYDYEDDLNEKKRNIKVIKKQYYNQIVDEFNTLTGTQRFTRRLI